MSIVATLVVATPKSATIYIVYDQVCQMIPLLSGLYCLLSFSSSTILGNLKTGLVIELVILYGMDFV